MFCIGSLSIDETEQERRLMELQQQLQLKERELKRRQVEAVRSKRDILARQEQAIQTRLQVIIIEVFIKYILMYHRR